MNKTLEEESRDLELKLMRELEFELQHGSSHKFSKWAKDKIAVKTTNY